MPHPAIDFPWLIAFVTVNSSGLAFFGVWVYCDRTDPDSLELTSVRTDVRSLLSVEGIRFVSTTPVANFMGFGAVGVILAATVGVGLAGRSDPVATLVKQIVKVAPRSILTFIVVLPGVTSGIAADAGYPAPAPLGAAGFPVNLFVTPTDALLAEMTNDAIRLVDTTREIGQFGNLCFMSGSSLLMGLIRTVPTDRFVEPHLGPCTGAAAKWAILAPVFVPPFMRLGGDPDLVLAGWWVGDSPGNVITPLNVYLGVMVGFARRYGEDAGIGTIMALTLSCTIVPLVTWTPFLIAWVLLGVPLGPV